MRSSHFLSFYGEVGPHRALFHISNANAMGRTPGGLAWCRAMLQAMFLFAAVFPVNLRHKTEVLNCTVKSCLLCYQKYKGCFLFFLFRYMMKTSSRLSFFALFVYIVWLSGMVFIFMIFGIHHM